jgi:RimJ/RimL family protein N-acetyltransferase
VLETKRLLLKAHTLENIERMNRWSNDAILSYYDDDGPEDSEVVPIENTKKYIERVITEDDDSIIRFGIHNKEDNSLIGFCMIAFIDHYNKSCMIGMTLGEKEEWGKGYGREVLNEIIRYCFEDLNMNRIGAEIYSFNERSIKMFENAGFIKEGIIRQLVYKRNKFEDEYMYGLLRGEWKVQ